jgi:hypothetical protein
MKIYHNQNAVAYKNKEMAKIDLYNTLLPLGDL